VSGANATQNVLKSLSIALQASATPITIIFQSTTSCTGITDLTTPSPEPASTIVWSSNGTANTCDVPLGGISVDVAVSDVFATTCVAQGALTSYPATGFGDFQGPIQSMSFIVPAASNESSISAQAAFAIFGWAGTGMYPVSPWTATTNTADIFVRTNTAGVEDMIATEINLPASKWKGTSVSSNSTLVGDVAAPTAPAQTTIGIASTESAQGASAADLKILAYQAADQSCGYLPDSSATSLDKLNVREGRYNLWGPSHFFAAVDASGVPTNANVKTFTDAITLATPNSASATSVIAAEATAGVVPQCAMKVSRAAEQSAESSIQPTGDCTGFYEASVPGGTTTHQACTVDGDCADAGAYTHCNYGYCEVQ
jgi:hypothetical protein